MIFRMSRLVFSALCSRPMVLSFSAVALLTAMLMRCCSTVFCSRSCRSALSRSASSASACAIALSRSNSTVRFSSVSAFVRFATSFLTASGKDSLICSFSAFSFAFSCSMAAYLPFPKRLAMPDFMLSVFSLSAIRASSSFSAISLSSSALRRCFSSFPDWSFSCSDLALSVSRTTASLSASAAFFSALACSASCFCLVMMKSVRSKCFLPVTSLEMPLSISRHSAKTVCISLMAFSSNLQDLPVSWFIQSQTMWA